MDVYLRSEEKCTPFPGSSPMMVYSEVLNFLSNLGFYVMLFEVCRLSEYLKSVVAVQQLITAEMVFCMPQILSLCTHQAKECKLCNNQR